MTTEEVEKKLKVVYDNYGAKDGGIDSFELQTMFRTAFRRDLGDKEFSLEACRSIITMVDKDKNGKLDFQEFSDVWRRIMQYRVAFKKYDRDNSGDMNVDELQESLLTWKIKINSTVLRALISRYANRRGLLSFDDYIQICCRVQSISEAYKLHQANGLTLDEYISATIYC